MLQNCLLGRHTFENDHVTSEFVIRLEQHFCNGLLHLNASVAEHKM
jgi:hypothetical protein